MISNFLEALTDLTWIFEAGTVSVLLFGESPYPEKADYEED